MDVNTSVEDIHELVEAASAIWEDYKSVRALVRRIRAYFSKAPGLLIIGPGGAGKSTLARILSKGYDPLFDLPGEYAESIDVETYRLGGKHKAEITVPPGQHARRPSTWANLHSDLAAGKFQGIIFLVAYGYDSFMISYKQHRFYKSDKDEFLKNYCSKQRAEELDILRQLAPHVAASNRKIWFLTLVTKEDLWWNESSQMYTHYREGEYADIVESIRNEKGNSLFRSELASASLVISNFVTGRNEQLKPNTAGYDQNLQVKSLRRLLLTIDALLKWERAK